MITIDPIDPNLVDNVEAIRIVRSFGLFSDEQIQEMYDKQLENDRKKGES